MRIYLKCTFLSDVILNSETATEKNSRSLQYIPGSNFLGIVAKKYNEFKGEEAFTVFHSGKVKFGDAHPAYDNQRSLRVPTTWFHTKGTDLKNHSFLLKDQIFIHPCENDNQLEQMKEFFFTENGRVLKTDHSFSLKSAHNTEKRKSQDSQMYSYDALSRGTKWISYIDFENETLKKKVLDCLIGKCYLGRSRSAQYGKVEIEEIKDIAKPKSGWNDNSEMFLYAESSLAFFDDYGQPTFQPSLKDLGIFSKDSAEFLWDKSQIRTRVFAPWNAKRKSRDGDRVCIDKGSVFVIKKASNFNKEEFLKKIEKGVGGYLNVGMGQVLLNPYFLEHDNKRNPKIDVKKEPTPEFKTSFYGVRATDPSDKHFLSWLDNKRNNEDEYANIIQEVNSFLEKKKDKFKKISPSQWGAIRAIAQNELDYQKMMDALFKKSDKNEEKGFLLKGKSEKIWKNYEILEKSIAEEKKERGEFCARIYTIKLCTEMAKMASQSSEN